MSLSPAWWRGNRDEGKSMMMMMRLILDQAITRDLVGGVSGDG